MGTIDKLWVKLTCNKCTISESSSASDKGSGWSGSHWNDLGAFANFDVTTTGGGKVEPDVASAKCKSCGQDAIIEETNSFTKPDDF